MGELRLLVLCMWGSLWCVVGQETDFQVRLVVERDTIVPDDPPPSGARGGGGGSSSCGEYTIVAVEDGWARVRNSLPIIYTLVYSTLTAKYNSRIPPPPQHRNVCPHELLCRHFPWYNTGLLYWPVGGGKRAYGDRNLR